MELFKKIRFNMGINAILTMAVGILFIVNPGGTTAMLAWIAGLAILIMGIADVIRYFTAGGAMDFCSAACPVFLRFIG